MSSIVVKATPALIILYAAGGHLIAQSLARHTREAELTVSLQGKPVPKWENGLMVLYQDDIQPPEVSVFNNDGRMLMKAAVTVPDAARVWIEGTAVSQTGTIAVSGPAMKNDGSVAGVIAWLRSDGTIERLVRTSPFTARRLCFTSDGTLWAAGRERSEDGRSESPHNILRRYDKNGQVIGSYLPNTDFTKYSHEATAEDSFLMSTNDTIGLYSASSRVFVELDYSGNAVGRWAGLVSDRTFDVTGAGMLRGGSIYVSGQRRISGSPRWGIEYYTLDKQKGSWIRVDGAGLVGYITGAQDDQLIVATGGTRFVWIAASP